MLSKGRGTSNRIKVNSTTPSYHRTRHWLVEYIAEQNLMPGDKLPSERALAEALSFSRPTIARAISELITEGRLVRVERRGTYISHSSPWHSKQANTIGIIMPWLRRNKSGAITGYINNHSYPVPFRCEGMSYQVQQGVLSILNNADFRLIVHSNTDLADEIEVLHRLPHEDLDGAIIMPAICSQNAHLYSKIAKTGLPVVLVDHYFPNCPMDRVVTDNLTSARQAVEYLIKMGHRRIAHFTDFAEITSTMDRERGYRAALEEAGIAVDEEIICGPQLSRHMRWNLQYALKYCLSLPDPITAVFCHNDDIVLATLQAAKVLGMKVPEDLTVAGFFDDSIPAGMESPFIRVVQDKVEIGRIAANLLLERIAGTAPAEPRHVTVPAELVP